MAQYPPTTDNCSHSTLSVLCMYMLLLSAAFTVLVLLVSSVVRIMAPGDTQNVNVPFLRGLVR